MEAIIEAIFAVAEEDGASRQRKPRKRPGSRSLTMKQHGEAAEAAFLNAALHRGFSVLRPWGDSERFDFAIYTGKRFLRIQVKCTWKQTPTGYRVPTTTNAHGVRRDTYTARQIDFLAALIVPLDLWFIIPVKAFAPSTTICLQYRSKKRSEFARYREAWELLRR